MGVSLKTEQRRSHIAVSSFRPWVRRAEGYRGTRHLQSCRQVPVKPRRPPSLPLIYIVFPAYSSFSVFRETSVAFFCDYFKKLNCYDDFMNNDHREWAFHCQTRFMATHGLMTRMLVAPTHENVGAHFTCARNGRGLIRLRRINPAPTKKHLDSGACPGPDPGFAGMTATAASRGE